jgi:DNA-binding NarL/FixJ family response regulator
MRVFIADDSSVVRERLIFMLSECAGIEIVGESRNTREAIDAIRKLRPDVAILDIRMPGGGGIGILQEVRKTQPHLKIIMMTNYPYVQYRTKCLEAGADFFFDKSREFNSITKVLKGENLFSSPSSAPADH